MKALALYVDESIHENLGFIVTAFVFSDHPLEEPIKKILITAGLKPGEDEFKSSFPMKDNPKMREVRDSLINLATQTSKIALVFSPCYRRSELGDDCIKALQLICQRNGISPDKMEAFFDEGIFLSKWKTEETYKTYPFFISSHLHSQQNSKICLGIQLADLIAHSAAQIVRENISGHKKFINIGGPDTGYSDDQQAPLSWSLLMTLRHNFLVRPIAYEGERFDPTTEPIIIGSNDDPASIGANPELIGWGVQIMSGIDKRIETVIEKVLRNIWLGCIH